MNVRDIKTEVADAVKKDLAKKFICYGVVIEQVNVMNIILPKDMREALMKATQYDVLLQRQVKQREFSLLKLHNAEKKQLLKLERDNMQDLFTLQHELDVKEIEMLNAEIELETNKILAETKALEKRSKRVIEAENQRKLAQIRAQKQGVSVLSNAKAYQQKRQIDAEM